MREQIMSDSDSSHSSSDEDVSEPWGTLQSEIYLLNHYDSQSPLPPSVQARTLIKAYIRTQHERIDEPVSPPAPTPQQLAFPKSWRPLSVRNLVTAERGVDLVVWVRTYYSPETDAKHAALISGIDIVMAIDSEERVLDDASLYGGFGDHWEGLFELMPELLDVGGTDGWYRARITEEVELLQEARLRLQHGLDAVDATREGKDKVGEMVEKYKTFLPEERVHQEVLDDLLDTVHRECVVKYIIIEDKTTLECDESLVLLAFVDAWGRVVKSRRVTNSEAEQMSGMWFQHAFDETMTWDSAEIGNEYKGRDGWEDLLKDEDSS